jgi:hypothetical protein
MLKVAQHSGKVTNCCRVQPRGKVTWGKLNRASL